MEQQARSVTWEAPEHHHIEKGGDWFFALAIITVSAVIAAIFFGNLLFALLCGLAGITMAIAANQRPKIIPFAVTVRGIRIDEVLYPYTTLRSYHIDEDDYRGPQLFVISQRHFMPLLILPIPEEYIDDIEDIITGRLAEEFIEEPFFNKLLEILGF
ncbi:hypothetical protein COZ82_01800 [Candidatus Kaiserbacteria bacterium CG_4_8_14_3_um_filter_38_9]|uniref:DUF5673 domain-containing protein n=1 Tax=Candidatus Kaiserbacteria bacterium CG_4_8_14_3_um_filter_38_9 TaxID=1974599 RepID=A0A2M7IP80_9BACT|nr:MAG: hypothetical protein COZ82_01800 [Candidatus Kaiserbacteria bacterium CG_4_8_14_3_um_filter_38_9]